MEKSRLDNIDMYTEAYRQKIYKKWIDSGKRARLTEEESRALAEVQTQTYQAEQKKPKTKNEVQAFDRLINNRY